MSIFDDDGYDQSGAGHLADIYGTEKDKVNCPFYWKIGACRHGEKCSRNHNKPALSQTLLIPHMYPNPMATPIVDQQGNPLEFDPQFLKEHFEEFYEDVFDELSKYGKIEELNVCENIAEHMFGNVYVKFTMEDEAQIALHSLRGRYYAGQTLNPEFSPVTDFKEARCKDFEQTVCERGGNCNFMHLKRVSSDLGYALFGERFRQIKYSYGGARGGDSRSMRSSSDYHHHSRSHHYHHRDHGSSSRSGRGSHREHYYDRDYDRDRHSSRSSSSRRDHGGRSSHRSGNRRSRSPTYKSSSSRHHKSSRYDSGSPVNGGAVDVLNGPRTPSSQQPQYQSDINIGSGQKRKREIDENETQQQEQQHRDHTHQQQDDGFGGTPPKRPRQVNEETVEGI